MNKLKENIVVIILLSSLILLTGLSFFLYSSLQKAEEKVSTLKNSIRESEARNTELDLIKINLKNTLENFQMLDALFVKHEEVADFLQEVEILAKSTGLSIKIIGVSKKDIAGISSNKEYLLVTASTQGDFKNTMKFMRLLELLPRKIGFDKVILKSEKGEKGESVWEFQMSFYLIKEKEL
ncbi:MAG: hypothetical protein QG585_179 [Patescibacteria group bacterium]|jgi:Tfp pilus assembly protein PilO|nr:hypothetical protein [Patescibacteria group bacterium]